MSVTICTAGAGLPPDQLLRETNPAGEMPADVGLELAKLDENEMLVHPAAAATRAFC